MGQSLARMADQPSTGELITGFECYGDFSSVIKHAKNGLAAILSKPVAYGNPALPTSARVASTHAR